MRNWLIRKLGGIPRPKEGDIQIINYKDGGIITVTGDLTDAIRVLGGVPMPKPGAGQYVVRPTVKRNPIRKSKQGQLIKDE